MKRSILADEVSRALASIRAGAGRLVARADASQAEISERIKRERDRGHPEKQAEAIAYSELGEPGGRKDLSQESILDAVRALKDGVERLDARIERHSNDAARHDYITESGGKFTMHAGSGKPMGTYGSKSEAEKRLREIEYFKHKG